MTQQAFQTFTFANGVSLKNRIVMPPMTTWSGNDDGTISDEELAYYRARSGGVGMVITGTTYTIPNGRGFSGQFAAYDDRFLPSLTSLATTIKQQGAKAILQIFHAGRMSTPELANNDVVSASAVAAPRPDAAQPRALMEEEIKEIIVSFAAATRRAIAAGFDGVEIHGANSYLIQQFFSPHSNRRDDAWGGTREKRARFPLAVVDAVCEVVREQTAKDFIVGYRFSPEEIEEPGITLDDTFYLLDQLVTKPLTYLHASLRQYNGTSLRDEKDKRVVGAELHRYIGGRLSLIGVGRVLSADDLAKAFDCGYELVAVGRALIADAQWVQKVQRGEAVSPLPITRTHVAQHDMPKRMFEVMKVVFAQDIAD
jgi:NADH:flavin oxidoreductases, Old Yellow Enzyme family